MNAVRAVGAGARRNARAAARADRGLPAPRRRPAPFPTGRLRDSWPSVALRRPPRHTGAQLLGTAQPPPSLAQRSRVPTGLRDLHMYQLPGVVVSRPAVVPPADPAAPEAASVDVGAPVADPTAVEQAAATQAAETARIEVTRAAALQLAAAEAEAEAEAERVRAEQTAVVDTEPAEIEPAEIEPAEIEPAEIEPAAVAVAPEAEAERDEAVVVPEAEHFAAVAPEAEPDEAVPAVAPEAEQDEAEQDEVEAAEIEPAAVAVAPVTEQDEVEPAQNEPEQEPVLVAASPAVPAPPAAAPAPPVVPPPPGGTTASRRELAALQPPTDTADVTERSGSRRNLRPSRRLLAAVGAVVVVAAVGTAVGVVISQQSDTAPPAAVASTSASTTAVTTWLQANVPSTMAIVSTDAALTTDLGTSGLVVTTVPALDAVPAMSVVVTAGSPDAAAAGDPIVITASRTLVPLAVFDLGSDRVVAVGQSVERPVADIEQDQQAGAATARSASTGLLDNAAVTVSAEARPVLEAGRLDLRAAALLAVAAGTQPVQVVGAPVDAAESATGVPVRRLVVAVGDPEGLRNIVASSRYPYTPEVTVAPAGERVPAGSLLLTWPILADPALTVN